MSYLSDPSQCAVINSMVARRTHLKERIAYWAEVMARPRVVVGAEASHAEALKHLEETEAAMRELDKRVVPWLHCHPDCSDLFASKQLVNQAAEAA